MKNMIYACLGVCCLLAGCGGYDGLSPEAYEYAKSLYSICNLRDDARLSRLEDQLITALESQQISAREATWLNETLVTAQAGDWRVAMSEARRMMEDQVDMP